MGSRQAVLVKAEVSIVHERGKKPLTKKFEYQRE